VKLLWRIVKWSILGIFCISCVVGVGAYYLVSRLLRVIPISYNLQAGHSSFTHCLQDIRYQSTKLQISVNQVMTGNLFSALTELLFKYPFTGGIQADTVTIGGNLIKEAINRENLPPQNGHESNNGATIKRFILALKSPIFRFPKIQIKKIQIEDFPFSIENIHFEDGFLSCELFHRDRSDLCLEFSIKVKSLRKALQAWQATDDSLKAFWAALNKFNGYVHAESIPINVLARYISLQIRPFGTLTGTLALKSGKAYGNIKLFGIETRPMNNVGIIRDLQCCVNFDGDVIRIEEASAHFRQGEMALNGTIEHKRWQNFQFNLHASGFKVPLFQKNGALLVGDVDFGLVTEVSEQGPIKTTLSGNVNFLPSRWYAETIKPKKDTNIFLHDRITLPKNWDVNISLNGDQFLRVNMPYFHGVLSAHATIYGTTGAPAIYGQGIINQGVILFPFARFRITQGVITIDPTHFTPIWDVDSETRLYNYNLRLHLFGEGFTPTCLFSASPTLSNGAIINMITAGRQPGNKTGAFSDRNQASILGVYLGSNLLGGNFADRVRIQMGQDVYDGGNEAIQFEFVINSGSSVLVERDRFNNYNVDIKIKIL
jgi:hypothetical protein